MQFVPSIFDRLTKLADRLTKFGRALADGLLGLVSIAGCVVVLILSEVDSESVGCHGLAPNQSGDAHVLAKV